MDFKLIKKPDLVLIAMEFIPPQLHSESGLFISKTYAYSTFILIIYLNLITFLINEKIHLNFWKVMKSS